MPSLVELHSLNDSQVADVLALMAELDSEIKVTPQMLRRSVESPNTHFFALVGSDSCIAGCASLCVFASPTGLKASIEDVVVGSAFRGRHFGKALVEHILDYARANLSPVEIHLTSRPARAAANALYLSLGFTRKETNFYKLEL